MLLLGQAINRVHIETSLTSSNKFKILAYKINLLFQ